MVWLYAWPRLSRHQTTTNRNGSSNNGSSSNTMLSSACTGVLCMRCGNSTGNSKASKQVADHDPPRPLLVPFLGTCLGSTRSLNCRTTKTQVQERKQMGRARKRNARPELRAGQIQARTECTAAAAAVCLLSWALTAVGGTHCSQSVDEQEATPMGAEGPHCTIEEEAPGLWPTRDVALLA